jgi:hypothetical protein
MQRTTVISKAAWKLTEARALRSAYALFKGMYVPVLNQLSTTPSRRMGSGGIAPAFLISGLHGNEWPVSRPGRFTPWETVPGTHWVG